MIGYSEEQLLSAGQVNRTEPAADDDRTIQEGEKFSILSLSQPSELNTLQTPEEEEGGPEESEPPSTWRRGNIQAVRPNRDSPTAQRNHFLIPSNTSSPPQRPILWFPGAG